MREWYQQSRLVNLFALVRAILESDLVFGWFASWHTFFPILIAAPLRRPSVLIVGGYDTANLPEIGYGSQRGGIKKWIAGATMRSATRLVTNSNYTRAEVLKHVTMDAHKVTVIYHGLDTNSDRVSIVKENLVITVGNVDRDNLQRKGLEPFVRAAALLPDVPFVVIGAWRDDAINHLRSIASPNVQFTDYVNDSALEDLFSRAKVYVQASRHEGFGLAVAEAMLHECLPVVTRAGSLPEVVDDVGIFVESNEPADIAEGIKRAFELDAEQGHRGRERIVSEFPREHRREKLFALIDELAAR